ncbi:MAG: hypothetical protein UV80_C0002G0311 [Candidatus Peregrinibacteria bacterium GW2011_GWF2_43_17]|nr:MAG: hypothetical protein UV80_C0002G0311 [Candidatus Peregrinibacteria bacterium GW2011_GWF2_43_17]HAU39647.1 hypothetical protein [Candidatus Peregrinibacteria bacterium]
MLKELFSDSQKQLKKIKRKFEILKKSPQEESKIEEPIKPPKVKSPEKIIVHLSTASVAKATLVIILFYLLAQFVIEIKSILIILFISLLFYAALDPIVDNLQKKKIPRAISVLGIYIVLLGIVVFFISSLIPIVADQLFEIAKQIGTLITNVTEGKSLENLPFSDKILPHLQSLLQGIDQQTVIDNIKGALENIAKQLENIAGNTFTAIKVIFNGIFNAFLVLIITFFLVTDDDSVDNFIKSIFPTKYGSYIVEKSEKVKNKVGLWLRGIVTLMLLMFTLYFIGFSILGIEYAVTLAMMGGIAELFPVIGPILAGVPAALIAFNESPWLVLWALGIIVLAQQIEGNILIPLVMRKAVGLKPVIVLLSVLMGYQLLGIVGILMAVPVAAIASIFISDYIDGKDK